MNYDDAHEAAAYERGHDAGWKKFPCIEDYYPEGNLREAYLMGYRNGTDDVEEAENVAYSKGFRLGSNRLPYKQEYMMETLANEFDEGYKDGVNNQVPTQENDMVNEYTDYELKAYGHGFYEGASGMDSNASIYTLGSIMRDAYVQGYEDGQDVYDKDHAPVPVRPEGWEPTIADDRWELTDDLSKQERLKADGWQFGDVEDFLSTDLMRFEQNAWKSGYHHALTGSDAYNVYREGTMAHALYDEGYEVGAKEYNAPVDEDFPEHEGLDNQDYGRAADLFVDVPDEVVIDNEEDEVVKRVAEKWNLNDFVWDDNDDRPSIAIQIKDGEVYEAFSTTPIRLYVVDELTEPEHVPAGLKVDVDGNLNYASEWARGNVDFAN